MKTTYYQIVDGNGNDLKFPIYREYNSALQVAVKSQHADYFYIKSFELEQCQLCQGPKVSGCSWCSNGENDEQ